MKLADLFKTLAERAGVDLTAAKFQEALGALPDTDLDDDVVANPLLNTLITEGEVLANPKVKGRLRKEALDGIDRLVDPFFTEFFDADELTAIRADESTSKKLQKLLDKAKTKAKSGNQPDAAKAIQELNDELARVREEADNRVTSLTNEYDERLFFNTLAGQVVVRDDVVDFAKAKNGQRVINDLRDTLKAVGGKIDYKTNKVVRADDPTSPLYEKNKEVTVADLMTRTLSENNYIKKSETTTTSTVKVPTGTEAPTTNKTAGESAAARNLAAVRSKIEQQS